MNVPKGIFEISQDYLLRGEPIKIGHIFTIQSLIDMNKNKDVVQNLVLLVLYSNTTSIFRLIKLILGLIS